MSRRSRQADLSPLTIVLEQLPKLTITELHQVKQRIGYLRTVADAGPVDVDEQIVIDAISAVLRENGIAITTDQVANSPVHTSFLEKLPALHTFLATASPKRNHQRALLQLGVELLYAHLTKIGIPVGVRTLMAHIHRIPEFINIAFPGYAQAGLLSWITRAATVRRRTTDADDASV